MKFSFFSYYWAIYKYIYIEREMYINVYILCKKKDGAKKKGMCIYKCKAQGLFGKPTQI